MKSVKSHILVPLLMAVLAITLSAGAQAQLSDPATSDEPVLHLGKIEVSGQRQIMEALQAIKIALKRPESSDPSQQNVIVCRIEKDIGSHEQDLLTCATNRTLSLRRQGTQSGIITACEGVAGTSCYPDQAFGARSPLNDALQSTEGHMLHMPVNAASLRSLLAKIPDPAPEPVTAPAVSSAPAPAATTAPSHS